MKHEKYDANSRENDLALLFFNGKGFNITDSVKPICLWNRDNNFKIIVNKTAEARPLFSQAKDFVFSNMFKIDYILGSWLGPHRKSHSTYKSSESESTHPSLSGLRLKGKSILHQIP